MALKLYKYMYQIYYIILKLKIIIKMLSGVGWLSAAREKGFSDYLLIVIVK